MTFSMRNFFITARKECKENLMEASEPAEQCNDVGKEGLNKQSRTSQQTRRLEHFLHFRSICLLQLVGWYLLFISLTSLVSLLYIFFGFSRFRLFGIHFLYAFFFRFLFIYKTWHIFLVDGMWCDVCCEWINYDGWKTLWLHPFSNADERTKRFAVLCQKRRIRLYKKSLIASF
jgi:hypothetical protein